MLERASSIFLTSEIMPYHGSFASSKTNPMLNTDNVVSNLEMLILEKLSLFNHCWLLWRYSVMIVLLSGTTIEELLLKGLRPCACLFLLSDVSTSVWRS